MRLIIRPILNKCRGIVLSNSIVVPYNYNVTPELAPYIGQETFYSSTIVVPYPTLLRIQNREITITNINSIVGALEGMVVLLLHKFPNYTVFYQANSGSAYIQYNNKMIRVSNHPQSRVSKASKSGCRELDIIITDTTDTQMVLQNCTDFLCQSRHTYVPKKPNKYQRTIAILQQRSEGWAAYGEPD